MMTRESSDQELRELLSKLLDDELDASRLARLGEILHTQPEARALYHQYMNVHGLLEWTLSPPVSSALPDDLPPTAGEATAPADSQSAAEPPDKKPPGTPVLGWLGAATRQGFEFARGPVGLLLLVVILAGGLALVSLLTGPRNTDQRVAEIVDIPPSPAPVARITRLADIVWSQSGTSYANGAKLAPGERVQLVEGVAEITFSTGARVVLEGGTAFEPESENAGRLYSGRLTVDCPKQAVGYTVFTPKAEIVDLGTEFGLSCGEKETTKVQVYAGSVDIAPFDNSATTATERARSDDESKATPRVQASESPPTSKKKFHRLAAGQAARLEYDGQAPSVVIRPIALRRRPDVGQDATPSVPKQGLRLWLKADAGACQDVAGVTPAGVGDPVARWINQAEGELSPRQMVPKNRPRLAQDRRGNLVLRFDGTTHFEEPRVGGKPLLVLSPSARGERFTMFAVFSTETIEPERQAIFGQFDSVVRTNRYLRVLREGRVSYDEFGPSGGALSTPAGTVKVGNTYVVALKRDGPDRSIYVNGRLLAHDAQAEVYRGARPRAWRIGARAREEGAGDVFHGDIAEIIIYRGALERAPQQAVETYLTHKYLGGDPM